MTLFRRAGSRDRLLEVVNVLTWHALQPTLLKIVSPVIPDRGVCGGGPRNRWKSVITCVKVLSTPLPRAIESSGSATASQKSGEPRFGGLMPLGSFSVGRAVLVKPISFSEASNENVRTVATWAFHPKRPA